MNHAPPLVLPVDHVDREALLALRRQYVAVVGQNFAWVLDRFERDPDEGLIDTKMDVLTGADAAADDPIRGRGTVYGWIQARALEALGAYRRWLHHEPAAGPGEDVGPRVERALDSLVDRLETMRPTAGGHLHFMMDRAGHRLTVTPDGVQPAPSDTEASTLTDLFYARGLIEAASLLGRADEQRVGEALLAQVLADVRAGRFIFDQVQLDPANPVTPTPGRHSQAPWMLLLAGYSRLAILTGDAEADRTTRLLMDQLAQRHVARESQSGLQVGDFWEFVNDAGEPYVNPDGTLPSDPGHAIEAAGFALQHLNAFPPQPGDKARRALWQQVLHRNLANGLSGPGPGICKAFDLRGRRPINPQMPWWSLPETMRAMTAAEDWTEPGHPALPTWRGFARTSNALTGHYLRPEAGWNAVQCLDADGQPVATIPATPDLDPGYHTNLCLMRTIDRLPAH